MAFVIVAGALGVSIITGGLFLRRLLGELADLHSQLTESRRQITGIDRQMRAQRAHVTFLRPLLTEDDEADSPPGQVAVVNGGLDPSGADPAPDAQDPVRRKRHLGLYIGGAVAALATVSTVARDALREHCSHLVVAATSAAVTASTVTMITVQPWSGDSWTPPSGSPPVSSTLTGIPSEGPPPQPPPTAQNAPPSFSQPGTETGSPTATPSSPSPKQTWLPGLIAIHGADPGAETSLLSPGSAEPTGDGIPLTPGMPTGEPPPPPESPTQSPPPAEAAVDPALCASVTLPPLIAARACVADS